MKKGIFLILTVVIVACLFCGCVTQSSSQKAVSTPAPTPKTDFNVNEPASDNFLRITVIQSSNYPYTIPAGPFSPGKTWMLQNIVLKLENLRSDRSLQILASDFKLIDYGDIEYTNGYFKGGYDSKKYTLTPGQREQVELIFEFNEGTEMSRFKKLKFDFSGSGGNTARIVYFNL